MIPTHDQTLKQKHEETNTWLMDRKLPISSGYKGIVNLYLLLAYEWKRKLWINDDYDNTCDNFRE